MSYIVVILLVICIIGIYILLYRLNKSVPIPEEAKNLLAECSGCSNKSCGHHPGN